MRDDFIDAISEESVENLVEIPKEQIELEDRINELGYEFAFGSGFDSREDFVKNLENESK